MLFAVGWGSLATRAAKSEWQLAPLLALSLVSFWFGVTQLLNFFSNEYTPGKFLTNPVLPDAESIAIGESLYQEKGIENTAMPAFGDELTTEETWHLVNYVRRLSAQAVQVTQNQGPS